MLESNEYNFKRSSFSSKVNRSGILLPELSLTSNTVLQGTLLEYRVSPCGPSQCAHPPLGSSQQAQGQARSYNVAPHKLIPGSSSSCVTGGHRHAHASCRCAAPPYRASDTGYLPPRPPKTKTPKTRRGNKIRSTFTFVYLSPFISPVYTLEAAVKRINYSYPE